MAAIWTPAISPRVAAFLQGRALGLLALPPAAATGPGIGLVPGRHRAARGVTTAQPAAVAQLVADRKELLSFFPTMVEDIKADSEVVGIPEETECLGKLLEYVVGGRLFRGCSALNACRELMSPDRAILGRQLGLALEMMQGYVVVADDLVDNADLRHGRPSWHTLPGVGLRAVTDAFLVHAAMCKALERYFRTEPNYTRVLELFNEGLFRGVLAQNYECRNGSPIGGGGAARFDAFGHAMHQAQARSKIAYYTFYNPLATALHLAQAENPARLEELWRFSCEIGQLFVVQDDYSDCYEPVALSGKSQCDIRNGKCTWLVAEAKLRANERQRALLKENYGFDDAEKVAAVMDLYAELGVEESARDWISGEYARLSEEVYRQRLLPPSILHYALESMQQPLPQSENV